MSALSTQAPKAPPTFAAGSWLIEVRLPVLDVAALPHAASHRRRPKDDAHLQVPQQQVGGSDVILYQIDFLRQNLSSVHVLNKIPDKG